MSIATETKNDSLNREGNQIMKHVITLATIATALLSVNSYADGWVCEAEGSPLVVKVYNQTQPTMGTRNAAVMVLSDASIAHGRKTIARFESANGLLTSEGAHFVADVDLRFKESNRKGELLGGTKLGQLDTIALDIEFSYAYPVMAGDLNKALITLNKRNGEFIELDAECVRYLKH